MVDRVRDYLTHQALVREAVCQAAALPPVPAEASVSGEVKELLLRRHLLAVSRWPLRMAILSQGGQPGAWLPPVLGEG